MKNILIVVLLLIVSAQAVSANSQERPTMPNPNPNISIQPFSATLTKLVPKANGAYEIYFADGTVVYANSLEDYLSEGMPPDIQSMPVVQHLLIWWWYARDSDFSNPNLVVGKTLTLDLSAASPIKVQ